MMPATEPPTSTRTWVIACHLSAIAGFFFPFGNILGPLIVWLLKRDEIEIVNDQGKESLNFQISMSIYLVLCIPLIFVLIGIPLLVILGIAELVLIIIAAVKANDGIVYRYPLTIRFIK